MKPAIPTELAFLVLALVQAHGAAGQTLDGPTACTAAGAYTLCQNLWGAGEPQSPSPPQLEHSFG